MAKDYFKDSEFTCKCDGLCDKTETISDKLRALLNEARETAGIPFVITSGYRCEKHNAKVGGVKNSSHTKGVAVDILATDNSTKFKIVDAVLKAGIERVGVAKTFIHIDIDADKASKVLWKY